MKFGLTAFVLGCACLFGCASYHQLPTWHELSPEKLILEVEQESRPDQLWRYSGSDQHYQYLYRANVNYFCLGRRHDYFKISKENCTWLTVKQERKFDGTPAGYAVLFSKKDDSINGFTHVVSRGIVHDPFNDGGALPLSLTNLLEEKKAFNRSEPAHN